MIGEIETKRIDEGQDSYEDRDIKEVNILEVRPLRFALDSEWNQSIHGFRGRIDQQRQDLENQLGELP